MDVTYRSTTKDVHVATLEHGFDLNLVPPGYTTLFKHQNPAFRARLINEFTLIVSRIRIELKRQGKDWNQLELVQQQKIFQTWWNEHEGRRKVDKVRIFGDTGERLEALHLYDKTVDKTIAQREMATNSTPQRNIGENTEQNTGRRTETEPKTLNIAPENIFAGTSQMSNGLSAGSHQHRDPLRPVHAYRPRTPSSLRQLTSTEAETPNVAPEISPARTSQMSYRLRAGSQHQGFPRHVHAHTAGDPSPLRQSNWADEM